MVLTIQGPESVVGTLDFDCKAIPWEAISLSHGRWAHDDQQMIPEWGHINVLSQDNSWDRVGGGKWSCHTIWWQRDEQWTCTAETPQIVVGRERNRQFWLDQWPHIPGVDRCDLPIHSDVIREQRQADKALSINYLQKTMKFQKRLHFLTKHARNWRVIMVRLQMNLVWRGSFH